MAGEGVFPKAALDIAYASEYNAFNGSIISAASSYTALSGAYVATSGALYGLSGALAGGVSSTSLYITVAKTGTATYVGSDHRTIQSGVNHSLASGLPLYIGSGEYFIGSPVVVDGHLMMYGAGPEYTKLTAISGLTDFMVKITAHTGSQWRTTFENFKLNGNAGSPNYTGPGGIRSLGGIEGNYNKLHFEKFNHFGLWLHDTGGGSGDYGHHNRIHQCLFDQGESSQGSGTGLYMRNNDENEISQCEFQYNKIGIKDETGFNTIGLSTFVDGGKGVYLLDCSRTRVVNCVFDYVGEHGVHLKGAFNTIANNSFYNCGSGTNNTYDCVLIDYYGSNIIDGNFFLQAESTNRARSAIKEAGTSGTNLTYGQNIISNNYIVSMAGATNFVGSFFWGTGSIIQANANQLNGNYYRQ